MATSRQLKNPGTGVRRKGGKGKVHILMFGITTYTLFPSARTRCGMFIGNSRYDQMKPADVDVIEKCTEEEICGNCNSLYSIAEVRTLTGYDG